MAEFCLDCWNRLNNTDDSKNKYILSKELDLCEGCGEWKHVIIIERRAYYMRIIRLFLIPVLIVYYIIFLILKLFLLFLCFFSINKKQGSNNNFSIKNII